MIFLFAEIMADEPRSIGNEDRIDSAHAVTGVFNTFLKFQQDANDTFEKAYNTDGSPAFNQKTPTHSILVGDAAVVKK